ncbi:MAG: hypothetical protein JEY79_16555 [Pseudodesulfovibrio sp.]|nr:hypothetical protein [Pseudodesulfovibrio sp.]
MTGLSSLALALGLAASGLSRLNVGSMAEATIFGCWSGGWIVVALFAMADGCSRHREYKRIKAMFIRYGYNERILDPLARSRCQRDAALLAATETGHRANANAYFTGLGYRWYHILPDSVIQNPFNFLKPSFLRASFLPGKKATPALLQ